MAKIKRQLHKAIDTQRVIEEKTKDKFSQTQDIAHMKKVKGRMSPQLSCTIPLESKQILNELTLYASNKAGKPLNVSSIIRSLIHFGNSRKEEIEF